MKRRRIAVLMHTDLVPPNTLEEFEALSEEEKLACVTEYDVTSFLRDAGHEILPIGLSDELKPLRLALADFKPHVVFNLLEEFRGEGAFDQHVVSYLELLRQPYTGCNPRALMVGRDKAWSKQILHYHRIRVPKFVAFRRGRRPRLPKRLIFPAIVKCLNEDASLGISQASIVDSKEKLLERVAFVHDKLGADAIAEEYIEGRELYVGVLGNNRLQVFPPWELNLKDLPPRARIATAKVKWDEKYRKRHNIEWGRSELTDEHLAHIERVSKRIYRLLGFTGYARLDFRLSKDRAYLLEANPNPDISWDGEFAYSAEAGGVPYDKLLERIVRLGIRRALPG